MLKVSRLSIRENEGAVRRFIHYSKEYLIVLDLNKMTFVPCNRHMRFIDFIKGRSFPNTSTRTNVCIDYYKVYELL